MRHKKVSCQWNDLPCFIGIVKSNFQSISRVEWYLVIFSRRIDRRHGENLRKASGKGTESYKDDCQELAMKCNLTCRKSYICYLPFFISIIWYWEVKGKFLGTHLNCFQMIFKRETHSNITYYARPQVSHFSCCIVPLLDPGLMDFMGPYGNMEVNSNDKKKAAIFGSNLASFQMGFILFWFICCFPWTGWMDHMWDNHLLWQCVRPSSVDMKSWCFVAWTKQNLSIIQPFFWVINKI